MKRALSHHASIMNGADRTYMYSEYLQICLGSAIEQNVTSKFQ